ncbi:desulfoferrodoxin [Desulforhopalus singaporensis]|uniref:Desulfoferrodoxin n=1 Tax=Desulforhopalus singaporensis TaxID=91360 RepID=A0A1H0U9H8_9BACT|nr:desulfoferrodoxin [Desulforhopalus singaporensis]SDP62952.1 superoxide reductase [Desulforhopalus singaporensis]
MAQKLAIYKCDICGNVIEVLSAGGAEMMCCGQNMTMQVENTTDAAVEKHVPVVEKVEGGYQVTVGSVAHPMTEAHWIEWIDLIVGDAIYRQFLSPSDKPEAFFPIEAEGVTVRAYCNLHGLWKK